MAHIPLIHYSICRWEQGWHMAKAGKQRIMSLPAAILRHRCWQEQRMIGAICVKVCKPLSENTIRGLDSFYSEFHFGGGWLKRINLERQHIWRLLWIEKQRKENCQNRLMMNEKPVLERKANKCHRILNIESSSIGRKKPIWSSKRNEVPQTPIFVLSNQSGLRLMVKGRLLDLTTAISTPVSRHLRPEGGKWLA